MLTNNLNNTATLIKQGNRKFYSVFLLMIIFRSATLAQAPAATDIVNRFDAYRKAALQEKLFLHSDKDFYLAGEICWFKIYAVDAAFHRPLEISKVAYVELLDANTHPVLQAKVALKEATGNGSLKLPITLHSGKYRLRAYTSWMKNFSAEYFFSEDITVINTRKLDTLAAASVPAAYSVGFFPEGGNMVAGLRSKIAFQITDAFGAGVNGNGIVIDDKNDTIIRFASGKFGMGNFYLQPQKGRTYKALVSLPGNIQKQFDLPGVFETGYVMELVGGNTNQLNLRVQSTAANLNQPVYLFVHTRGAIKLSLASQFRNGLVEFPVDLKKLGEGISHFTVFDVMLQPICERLYFKFPEQNLVANISLGANDFDTRSKINLHINTTNKNGQAVQANMSMAVYRIDSLQGINETDINSYLWLCADLNGMIESPSFYFGEDAAAKEAMENLMLTHGWRRFKWDEVISGKKPVIEFLPEYAGHIVMGKMINNASGQPAAGIGGYLSVMGPQTIFRPSESNEQGIIKFSMPDFYNDGEIIVQANAQQDSNYHMEIQSPFSSHFKSAPFPFFTAPMASTDDIKLHHTAVLVDNYYTGQKYNNGQSPNTDTVAFYGKPDKSYLLDNYVRFTTMEEVLREYVTPVNVRKRNGNFHLPVFDELRKDFFDGDPLVILDGVPVFDMNKVLNLDPLKIRKLEVMSLTYFQNNMFYQGVVNFTSYKGNMDGYELGPHATVIDYEGLQLKREFYSPPYENAVQKSNHLPDFRNLLYWSPDIKTNTTGKKDLSIFSSDVPGIYAIVLQGISADGKTVSKVVKFEVKPEPDNSDK
jgi:hypothetical protein